MKKILVAFALVACIGCTKYKPYANSPEEHLQIDSHLPLNVQDHLRPMYRSCTPDELVDLKTAGQIEQRELKCSAVVIQHEDWVHLVNWEAPADIHGQPEGALIAGFAVLRAAQGRKIVAGTIRDTGGWSTSFEFCEVHATDTEGTRWGQGKCWNTPKATKAEQSKPNRPSLSLGAPSVSQSPSQHLNEISRSLNQPERLREVRIPDEFWKDTGSSPSRETAYALSLSSSNVPELLVVDEDPDVCGSAGCPRSIYGVHTDVSRNGSNARHYKLLLGNSSTGSIHILETATNGYKDLLIDGSDGGSIFTFNGDQYTEIECFTHEYKNSENLALAKCSK